jgi:bifunctional non-homologous end joining protein LigD
MGPQSETPRDSNDSEPRFVIQEHHARALHWDFRLERDDVMASWALPKGLPLDPGRNHLAVPTEDHPLEYGSFSGQIPRGEYGAGSVSIWDAGTYELQKWSDREVMVVLHGDRASGRYVLFRTGDRSWMIHRMDPAPSGWAPVPDLIQPMLCTAGDVPSDRRGWVCEFKWDGVRAVGYVDGGRIRLRSRNDLDITRSYPELHALGRALGSRQAVLDGEVVVFDDSGAPSFGLLQQRMHVANEAASRRLAASLPITYLIFDLLHLDGQSTMQLAYLERRRLLESLELKSENWIVPPTFSQPPSQILESAAQSGFEGIVCKRSDSIYTPGRRSDAWIKVKSLLTQEVVVGGFTPGKGSRAGAIGALVVGIPGPDGLSYVGKVGSGFSELALVDLGRRFRTLTRKTTPFSGPVPKNQLEGAVWVRPVLVGEVRFNGWTAQGRLRQPSWRGLRTDKAPGDVRAESG